MATNDTTLGTNWAEQWAARNFGGCRLGDARRTKRLVKTAELVLQNPTASFASLDGQWKNAKGAYRLFANEDVTFEAIVEPHCKNTRESIRGKHCLLLCDTSEVILAKLREIVDGGDLGRGGGPGFLLHPAMAVDAESGELYGLAGAVVRRRKRVKKGETASQRKKRARESEIWGDVIDQVGAPDEHTRYTSVLDRGADSFEVFCHLRKNNHDWIVRVCQRGRKIMPPGEDESCSLKLYMEGQPVIGHYEVPLRSRKSNKGKKTQSRTARMEVRTGKVRVAAPVHKSAYEKESGIAWIEMSVVWAREVDGPKGADALDWMLYTSHEVASLENAFTVIGWYKERWLIEEYFKALKTGCKMESRQLRGGQALESLCGLLCVTAFEIFRLKRMALTCPDRASREVVPSRWVDLLCAVRGCPRSEVETVYGFYRMLARLGGFLGRKSDGEPGWQKLWTGWDRLATMARGAEAFAMSLQ